MTDRTIRRFFILLLVGLPLQYAVVGLVSYYDTEPWPALVLPAFKTVHDDTERVTVLTPQIEVHFSNADTETPQIGQLFEGLPRSHHQSFMKAQFRPASLSGASTTERARHPEVRQWLARRLATMYPGRESIRLDVVWRHLLYRGGSRPTTKPLDTLSVELP